MTRPLRRDERQALLALATGAVERGDDELARQLFNKCGYSFVSAKELQKIRDEFN